MTLLAPSLQSYFTDYAHSQRDLSPNTIATYRDTWRLLIKYVTATRSIPADKIDLALIDANLVTGFLDHLQTTRGNSVTTRNARLTAIRAVMGFALPDHPEHAHTIARVLAVPARRRPTPTVEFLSSAEADALLAAPDTSTWTGRRDQALLTLAVQTGLRVSELTSLTTSDIHTGTGAHVTCTGKGRRHRATPLTPTTLTVLEPFLWRTGDPARRRAVPRTSRTTPVTRRARATPGQTSRHSDRDLPVPARQAHHDAHAAAHHRHAPATSRHRRLRDRPLARSPEHRQHRLLPPRRHDDQAGSDRPNPPARRQTRHLHPSPRHPHLARHPLNYADPRSTATPLTSLNAHRSA